MGKYEAEQALERLLETRKPVTPILRAVTGDGTSSATTGVSGRAGYTWVRYHGDGNKASQVFNRRFPDIEPDVPVIVGKEFETDEFLQILTIDVSAHLQDIDEEVLQNIAVGKHGDSHSAVSGADPAAIDFRNITEGRVRVQSGLTVYVERFRYCFNGYQLWDGGSLTIVAPPAAGTYRLTMISLDVFTGTVTQTHGSAVSIGFSAPLPSTPDHSIPLALVRVENAQTALRENDMYDWRFAWHGCGYISDHRHSGTGDGGATIADLQELFFADAATIAVQGAGVITPYQVYHSIIASESLYGSFAEVWTIDPDPTFGEGQILLLRPGLTSLYTSYTITLRHGVGNISLPGGNDLELSAQDHALLIYNGDTWSLIGGASSLTSSLWTLVGGKIQSDRDVRIGQVTANHEETPDYGNKLWLSGGPSFSPRDSENSDSLWLARYNVALDQTELRINVGDNDQAEDALVIGYTSYISGLWSPVFRVGMNGLVSLDTAQFSLTPTVSPAEGRLRWNSDDGTLELGMSGGNVNLQIGQESLIRVKNTSGSLIANGKVVYITGGSGSQATISLADVDSLATAIAIGMTTEDIANGHFGYVTTMGLVRDVNTVAYPAGTILWLTDNGDYSDTRPTPPRFNVVVGQVIRRHATEGVIYAQIDIVPRLQGLSDVLVTGLGSGHILTYDSANSRFINGQIIKSGAGVLTLSADGAYTLTVPKTGTVPVGTGTAGRIAEWVTDANTIQASTLVKSGAGVLTLNAAGAYTLTVPETGTAVLRSGAFTSTRIPYASDANTLTDTAELYWNNYLVVGADVASSVSKLVVSAEYTNATAGRVSYIYLTKNSTSNGSYYQLGIDQKGKINVSNGVTDNGYIIGYRNEILRDQSGDNGTLASIYGYLLTVGHYNNISRTTTNTYGQKIELYLTGGTATNVYGLRVDAVTAITSAVTNLYGIYIGTAAMKNYFAGSVLVGTTTDGMTAGGSVAISQDLAHRGSKLGVFNTSPTTKQTVTGSRGGNAALASLLTALAAYGLITDSSSA